MARKAVQSLLGLVARDPARRRFARWAILSKLARMSNMRMYVMDLDWWNSKEHLAAWDSFPASNHDVKDRRFVLFSMAQSVAHLTGDTAECGVFDGASSHLICTANAPGSDVWHHVFDSFEGLSAPEADDQPTSPDAEGWNPGDLAVGLEQVRQNLARFELVKYYSGWIPERFVEVADRQFRFVHVDVDLYQPTRDSLSFFYPRLVVGGILLCDDYGSTRCPGARRAFDELAGEWGIGGVIELPTGQGFVVKS